THPPRLEDDTRLQADATGQPHPHERGQISTMGAERVTRRRSQGATEDHELIGIGSPRSSRL
ncbi:hypothetical protein, partial [Acrocarpospora macrocephala]|uniref:hypothetical protein n=1 Tax=Acrocarpospora macrocephala TaxID=150177 RepID=UPI0031D0EA76